MRALVSVHEKSGVVELARGLVELGWQIVSSGGTASALAADGLPVTPVEEVTGSPEMLDGRVKTLHPRIHGGILADRSKPEHMQALADQGIEAIDLVVCNLYPFSSDPSVELIDIGGPSMVRAAAKNHDSVGVVVEPDDYPTVLAELQAEGALTATTRKRLAARAFAHTADYDAAVARWMASETAGAESVLPEAFTLTLVRAQELRYGENPHQEGARYRESGRRSWWDDADQLNGKQLSYLNLYDSEAAWRLVHELGDRPSVAVIKHANPCGAAVASDIAEAYRLAHAGDPTSAFGGVVAVNRPVPLALAEELVPVFTEVVIAPDFDDEALELLRTKKNLRILRANPPGVPDLNVRSIDGGYLVQEPDRFLAGREDWRVVTRAKPTDEQWADLELAWRICARVTSNAIVLARGGQAVGIGAGQQSRVDASRIAAEKADGRATGGACASDAFFPFRDGVDAAAAAGASAVIQPGGSVRDDEVVAAADEHNMAMVFTGERHFKH